MKDANVTVVTQAALCIELLAKGLRKGFAKYRATVMQPIMDRLKEKKAAVADALGAALDAVFASTDLAECMEDIIAYLSNKNPQVKEGTMKFLIRCLRTTRDVPSKPEQATICEAGKKLLSESSPALRDGGAEILGTVMKIIGERAMTPNLEGLDDIRRNKVKEYFEAAEVKAKEKPKPKPAAAPKAAPVKKVMGGKKPVAKKAAPPAAAPMMPDEAPLAPQPTPRAAPGKLTKPGLGGLKKKTIGGPAAPGSPRRAPAAPVMPDDEPAPPPPQPRLGLSRGLAGRSLVKPAAPSPPMEPASPPPSSGLTAVERAEIEELRSANDRLTRQVEEMRQERSKFMSEIQELKNQNAGLIEDHTRDVLSIKAKETQLVRARSDAEATEQTNDRLRRELERLKKALSHAERFESSGSGMNSPRRLASPTNDDVYRDHGPPSVSRHRMSIASSMSEEKENGEPMAPPRNKFSPEMRYTGSASSSGRGSPARGFRSARPYSDEDHIPAPSQRPMSSLPQPTGGNGAESWRRAAEVTSQLKARIEQMKVC
jgi:cytoskeleton-associated protein 5